MRGATGSASASVASVLWAHATLRVTCWIRWSSAFRLLRAFSGAPFLDGPSIPTRRASFEVALSSVVGWAHLPVRDDIPAMGLTLKYATRGAKQNQVGALCHTLPGLNFHDVKKPKLRKSSQSGDESPHSILAVEIECRLERPHRDAQEAFGRETSHNGAWCVQSRMLGLMSEALAVCNAKRGGVGATILRNWPN